MHLLTCSMAGIGATISHVIRRQVFVAVTICFSPQPGDHARLTTCHAYARRHTALRVPSEFCRLALLLSMSFLETALDLGLRDSSCAYQSILLSHTPTAMCYISRTPSVPAAEMAFHIGRWRYCIHAGSAYARGFLWRSCQETRWQGHILVRTMLQEREKSCVQHGPISQHACWPCHFYT
ncbi:hypothetical protein FB567DRAFT_12807 [Paraphoma chrysanthemicola]|uniref:Uncharacterized protein n=1 Tax=Paraphoma chrysanthemicola TaxID=798071 RepID=A0A8K0W4F4_9PLEO|nr:hypothetical protein FB567DRAFT_12807 [Paraphoma chrysanthemicola]